MDETRVRTGESTNGHICSICCWLQDPDEKTRAGTSFTFRDGVDCRLRRIFRHSPRRSKPCFIMMSRQAAVEMVSMADSDGNPNLCRHRELLSSAEYGPSHARVLGGDGHDCSPIAATLGQRHSPSAKSVSLVLGCMEYCTGT